MQTQSLAQIVIVGGGFGGLSAAKELAGKGVCVTLMTRLIITYSNRCFTKWRLPACHRPTSRNLIFLVGFRNRLLVLFPVGLLLFYV